MTGSVKRASGQHHGDLRNALLAAAQELVAEKGPRGFTVAEAARRAGASTAAPYKHFADRDALLAALAAQGYAEQERRFTAAMATRRTPTTQLVAVARSYVELAVQERALFDAVFSSGLDKAQHPALAAAGGRVLELLLGPARALVGDRARSVVVSVAALAHGHAVFLREGALGPLEAALPGCLRDVEAGVRALLAPGLPGAGPALP